MWGVETYASRTGTFTFSSRFTYRWATAPTVSCSAPRRSPMPAPRPPCLSAHRFARLQELGYDALVHVPDPRPTGPLPLVLMLHGAGERGADLSILARHGLVRDLTEGAALPFAVVAPQCPPERWWNVEALLAVLDAALGETGTDPARVAVTGYSMGGYGAWALATRAPERLAACVPVCGGGHPFFAHRLVGVPIRAYHGALDAVVPLRASVEMVDAVNAAGGAATLTVYPDVAHDSWTPAYADPGLYAWLGERLGAGRAG